MDPDARKKLKEKLRKKKAERLNKNDSPLDGETDIVKMMENVNKILKTNPAMVQQVSKCVSNVMNNKQLMESLLGQFQDQTLDSNDASPSTAASEK
jgi:chromatin segregation and condensation protein Rec8/ScpA/Scc1 (kleisin family)